MLSYLLTVCFVCNKEVWGIHQILHLLLVSTVYDAGYETNTTATKVHLLYTHMGAISVPCCMKLPMVNQRLFCNVNWFSNSSGSSMHGYGLCHSYGQIL
jgi:hypothetical protein